MTRSLGILAAITIFICLQTISTAEEAIQLKPDELQAAKEIREAERQRWKAKHGRSPIFVPVKAPLAYNCTNTVPVLPPRMSIQSDTCNLWRKSGHVQDEYAHQLVEFGLNCLSLNPTDATIREELLHSFTHTPQVDYVVELPDGTEIARSMQSSLVSDKFLIFDTQEASLADAKSGNPEPLAYARIDKGDKMAQSFCFGTNWRLNINEFAKGFWADPRSREVLMVMTTIKAVRDVNRDKDGRVTEGRCSEPFWLSVLILPLALLSVVLCFCWCPAGVCNVVCGCFKRMKYHPV